MSERTQTTRRRVSATRAIRTAIGIAGVAAAATTILVAGSVDLPDIGSSGRSVTVAPVPADQERVCAGAVVELGQDAAAATAATAVGTPEVFGADGFDDALDSTTLAAPDDSAASAGPVVLSAPPADGDVTLVGSQSQRVDRERVAGFAASACTEPAAEAWLVGGSTDVGQTTVVTLANPSTVEASVSLEVFGENGPVDAPGAAGIVVAPGTQRILSLAGIAPNLLTPVVHVTSVGAGIVANLQQSSIRAITPEGVDIVGSSTAAATEQTIPGFIVPSRRPIERADGYDARLPGVRVLVPGRFDGDVTVVARAADGTASEPRTVTAAAGSVIDVPLGDLPSGTYSVSVRSSEPVVVAGHSASERDDETDFAWFASVAPLTETAAVALVDGPTARVHIVNPTADERTVTIAREGREIEVTVPADGMLTRELDSGRVYVLSGTEGLEAAVSYLGDDGFASFPLTPPSAASEPVVVRTR